MQIVLFLAIALTLIPAISSTTVLCYFSRKAGYKPLMLYSIVIGIYPYILPIAPNPNIENWAIRPYKS